ncbi:glycosyltransferase [Nocardioides hungaricus]
MAVVLLGYVRDQVARGWPVTVACPASGWLPAAAADAGAVVATWRAGRDPGPSVAGEVRRLARVVAAARPDVVHLHSAKAGLAGRLAVHGRVPTIVQPHAWSFLAAGGPVRAAARAWERYAARWTTHLVCVSDAELALGRAAGVRGPASVVPNGVDLERLRPADRAAARAELGLPDAPTAVCVGRLVEQKGQHDLLDVWPAVRSAVAGATLVLVGDGPDRAGLEARRVEGVVLAGVRDDVPRWLAAADVVVAPSRWEGMALVPLEAMACGRSVVATDVAGMVSGTVAGTVPAEDPAALTDAVVDRLASPARADAEGAAGRALVEADHDAVRSAAAVSELVLRSARRAPAGH